MLSLCNASPAADAAPPLLVFDAQVTLLSAQGARQVPLTDFFVGPGQTVMASSELLTETLLPSARETEGSAFLKLGRVGADIAKVSVATRVVREGDTIVDGKIALGSVAPIPLRVRQAEEHLIGQRFTNGIVEEASQLAAQEISPITDVRSTASYRTSVAQVLVRDALITAWNRSGGEPV